MEKALEILLMDRSDIAKHKIVTTEMFNEAIAELEEAMKPKTCEWCKYQKTDIDRCDFCKRYYSDQYEPKDNA